MRNLWNKKIPTLLGIFIILGGLIVTTILTGKTTLININAGASEQPKSVRVSNITDTSFTVSYITQDQTTGSINYGENNNLGQTILDDRDQGGNITNYFVHYITVKNLKPSTIYYFTITSGSNSYFNNNEPFAVSTGPSISSSQVLDQIKGKIILPDGSFPDAALVYATSTGSSVFSSLSTNGNYSLDLGKARSGDLSSSYSFKDGDEIKLLIVGKDSSSNVNFIYSKGSDIPTITLSKDYDFESEEDNASDSATETFPTPTDEEKNQLTESAKEPEILTPQEDEEVSDQYPEFTGTALPNEDVQITIHSDAQIDAVVSTDPSGNWTYTPTEPLSPGEHTITIVTRNASGILQTITKTFFIQEALAQTVETTPTETPIPTISPTPEVIIQPTEISTQSSTTNLPPTGNPFIIAAGGLGMLISLIGSLLFLLSRKKITL